MVTIDVNNADEVINYLTKECPEEMRKMSMQAMRKAIKAGVKVIQKQSPSRFRYLVSGKMKKGLSGNYGVKVGFMNKHQQKGKTPIDDWFKAYWSNYGTLQQRDPSHKFDYPIKRNKNRRNERGQRHINFYENAKYKAIGAIEDAYVEYLSDKMQYYFNKS